MRIKPEQSSFSVQAYPRLRQQSALELAGDSSLHQGFRVESLRIRCRVQGLGLRYGYRPKPYIPSPSIANGIRVAEKPKLEPFNQMMKQSVE